MLDMGRITEIMKANLAKNDAWRNNAKSAIAARRAVTEFFSAAVEATEEARSLGIDISVQDTIAEKHEGVTWVRGSRFFQLNREGGTLKVVRQVSAGKGATASRDIETPSEEKIAPWVQSLVEEATDFLSDEMQSAIPTKNA